MGFPGELTEGWEQRALAKMGELLDKYRSLRVYMDACVHCGACSDKCHYFLGTGDPKNMPVARQDLMRAVYRPPLHLRRQAFPEAGGCGRPDEGSVRPVVELLQPVLRMPALQRVLPLRHRHRRGHHGRARDHGFGGPGPEVRQRDHRQGAPHRQQPGHPRAGAGWTRWQGLEEDTKDETGVDVRFPLDVQGAEVLLVTPSADFFSEPHVESLIGYAKVFHAAGRELDALHQGQRGRQLRPLHRQLRADAQASRCA